MINFSTLQGLTIPEGVVTKITDASGRVLWALSGGKVILEVEKITATTYAGETSYADEQFILLDIYPKTNGTVKVTYGGLTKTITDTSGAEEPNAQQVFFGTFNGVSDSVETPVSGELTIKGSYYSFGNGSFTYNSKGLIDRARCIMAVKDWGETEYIASNAFSSHSTANVDATEYGNTFTAPALPNSVKSIGDYAFRQCINLDFSGGFLNSGLVSIGAYAFDWSNSDDSLVLTVDSVTIPETVTSIGNSAFAGPIIDAYSRPYFKQVIVLPTTPPSLGPAPFGEIDATYPVPIIVPAGCGDTYKAAEGWSEYANYITEAS